MFYLLVVLNFLQINTIYAESAWLSTPESIEQFRNQVESFKPDSSGIKLYSVQNLSIKLANRDISIRVYNPGGKGPKPAFIYIHGGCFVAGSLDSHDEVSRYLAKESNSIVVAIDYRLAPEFKYPAAHNDVYDSVKWVWDNSETLEIDRTKFAIGGESAGAYFAAATSLRALKDPESPKISFQLLVYAALDGGGSSWTECKEQYFENTTDSRSEYGSPLWAENLVGLPKTFNIFGQYEISRVEEELFMRKLAEQGVSTKSFMVENVAHDVVKWATVTGDLIAHKKAVEYIRNGFGID
ncbi:MAG: alpha/beta hydrolase [Urechidicola sp.]|nr:alpha/beta hydrolase [Urechidicola sp.]